MKTLTIEKFAEILLKLVPFVSKGTGVGNPYDLIHELGIIEYRLIETHGSFYVASYIPHIRKNLELVWVRNNVLKDTKSKYPSDSWKLAGLDGTFKIGSLHNKKI